MRTIDRQDREEFEKRYRPPKGVSAVEWLKTIHGEQLELCRELEDIADSLPAEVNRQKCIYAAKAIGPLTMGAHRFEEDVLFPWVEQNVSGHPELAATLERLKFEHFEDECFIEELTDALLRLGAADPTLNAETIGYMLRGYFVSMRRHIAFEQDHLLAMVGERRAA
jgi:hypothetical protein